MGRKIHTHTPNSVYLEKKQPTSKQPGSYESYKEIIMKCDLNNHDSIKNTQSSVSFPAEGSAQPATTHRELNRKFHCDQKLHAFNIRLALTECLNHTAYKQEATAVECL